MTNGNDSAFPIQSIPSETHFTMPPQSGLTKREYFAAMAMQAMLANPELFKLMSDKISVEQHCEFLNNAAIEQADDMIEQLNKHL